MGMKSFTLACCVVLALSNATAGGKNDVTLPLTSRVAPPGQDVIAAFESAGLRDVRVHVMTPAELTQVEAALAALPALHRAVLKNKLRHLSFVDGIPGEGSGLTSKVGDTGQFDITLRASLLGESLSAFLTAKERRLFEADGSGDSVTVEATGVDALTYVLLHEATHVVDASIGITSKQSSPFVKDIWEGRTALVPQFAGSPVATTMFRGGRPIPVSQAVVIYDALAHSPFISLYATAAAPEDLAELVAWHEVSKRHGSALTITVLDANGVSVKRYEPLGFSAVKVRMRNVDKWLMQAGT
jgi:hypothetical protein